SRNSLGVAHVIPQSGRRVALVVVLVIGTVLPRLRRRAREPMARRSFTVIDVTEILIHWHAGRSINEVHQSLGVDRKTVTKYIAPAIEAGMVPGGPALTQAQWSVLVRDWFPGLVDTSLRQVTWPEIGRHHEYITGQLKLGV